MQVYRTPFLFLITVVAMWKLFHQSTSLKETNWRHRFEENSQDFFLLREFQNIREGPDTCICQRRFPNSIVLKKPECLEKPT